MSRPADRRRTGPRRGEARHSEAKRDGAGAEAVDRRMLVHLRLLLLLFFVGRVSQLRTACGTAPWRHRLFWHWCNHRPERRSPQGRFGAPL